MLQLCTALIFSTFYVSSPAIVVVVTAVAVTIVVVGKIKSFGEPEGVKNVVWLKRTKISISRLFYFANCEF